MLAVIEAHQHPFAGRPALFDAVLGQVLLQLGFGLLGGAPQRHFAQRREIAFAEEIVKCCLDALARVDIAVLHALAQGVRGDIDQLHFVGLVQDPVGQRFTHAHARDAGHQVVQTLQVLDIECGHHIDARIEDFQHVLVAFGVLGAGHVGMGQLVDQRHLGVPGDDGLAVHLFERHPPVRDLFARDDLQVPDLRLRLGPSVRLDVADYHIGAPALAPVPLVQHGVGLARAGGRGQVDAQATAPVCIAPGRRLRCGRGPCAWHGCGLRSFQVSVAQAVAAQELFWIGASLFTFTLCFVGRFLSHHVPIL